MSMNADREPIAQAEDGAPVDMLGALFAANGWSHEFASDDEIVCEIPGSWTTYQVRAIWRAEDRVLQLLCLPEVRVGPDKKSAAYELIALVNEQLWLGHFDIWSQGSVLLYRHGLMLADDGLLSLDMAQLAIDTALSECDRFYPAFQFVLWGDRDPQAALDDAMVEAVGEA